MAHTSTDAEASTARTGPCRVATPVLLAVLALAFGAPGKAQADDARVVALPVPADTKGGADIDRALRSALESLEDVELGPRPALDLEAVQLAIDCVDETPECLRQVARRLDAQILIAPSLTTKGQGVELRLLYFDAREDERRFAARREAAEGVTESLLAGVEPMVQELFETDEVPSAEAEPEPDASKPALEPAPVAPERGFSLGELPTAPLVIGGGGLLLVGGGIVAGVLARSTEREYRDTPVMTAADAEAADDLRVTGERQALAASLMLGFGTAAVVAAGVWLSVELGADERQARLEPLVGPDHAGLRLSGSLGAP